MKYQVSSTQWCVCVVLDFGRAIMYGGRDARFHSPGRAPVTSQGREPLGGEVLGIPSPR